MEAKKTYVEWSGFSRGERDMEIWRNFALALDPDPNEEKASCGKKAGYKNV